MIDLKTKRKLRVLEGRAKTGTTVPTTHSVVGQKKYNSAPSVGEPVSWVCVEDGYPGKWLVDSVLDRVVVSGVTVDQSDPSIDRTIAWHIQDANGSEATLLIPLGRRVIRSDLEIPATMTLKFQHGILADDANNATLTINGDIEAGHYQIFDWGNGTGDVTGTIGGIAEFSLKWTGATGDNSTDDTDAWNVAVGFVNDAEAMLYLPPGTYRLTPGSTNRIHRPFYGPEAVIKAHNNTDDVLLSVDTSSTLTTTDPYGRYELKAIIGYDVANHSVYDNAIVVAGTGIEVVAANYGNFRIARVVGFDIAIHLDGTVIGGANGVPCSSSEWNVAEIRHNNTGLKLTAAAQYNNEGHILRIGYFFDNRTTAVRAISSAVGKIQTNLFDIGVLECHVTADAHGIHLSGDLTYRNTFKIRSIIPPTGTGKIILTSATAVNNTFEVPTMDWSKVNSSGQGNIFDMHTSYNSDQMDVGNTPPGRSMIRGATAPGAAYWRSGDICWNDSPEDGVVGWICVAAGTPGTWVNFGTLVQSYSTTVANNGASNDNFNVLGGSILYVDTTGGNVTIGGLQGGAINQKLVIVKTIVANDLVIENNEAVGSQEIYTNDEADITLSSRGGVTLICNGTNWFVVSE